MHETSAGNSPLGPGTAVIVQPPLGVVHCSGAGVVTGTPAGFALTWVAANSVLLAITAATNSKDFLACMIYLLLNRFVVIAWKALSL
jgi:hypothetical protein